MEFQSDKVEAFKSIFKENQSKIIAQQGCYDVQLLQDIHESNIFFTYSKWKSQAHLDQYRKTDFFKKFGRKRKYFFAINP